MSIYYNMVTLSRWWVRANCFTPPFGNANAWTRDHLRGAFRILDQLLTEKEKKAAWKKRRHHLSSMQP